jgi:hypothetical protein
VPAGLWWSFGSTKPPPPPEAHLTKAPPQLVHNVVWPCTLLHTLGTLLARGPVTRTGNCSLLQPEFIRMLVPAQDAPHQATPWCAATMTKCVAAPKACQHLLRLQQLERACTGCACASASCPMTTLVAAVATQGLHGSRHLGPAA